MLSDVRAALCKELRASETISKALEHSEHSNWNEMEQQMDCGPAK